MSIKIFHGLCLKCGNSFTKEIKWGHIPKFCSKSCSHSRSQTAENNLKRSIWARANPTGCVADKSYRKTKNPTLWETIQCPTCSKYFEKYKSEKSRKYCSAVCRQTGGYRKESFRFGIKGFYKNIHCDSTWELAFLIYHLDHGNKIIRNPTKLSYVDMLGKERLYYPDFEVNGILYEIKGNMLENDYCKLQHNPNVVLMDKEKLKPIFDYIHKTYSKNLTNLKELYDFIDITGKPTSDTKRKDLPK